jgi:hypothetical protein
MVTRISRFSILQTGKLLAVFYGFFSVVLFPIVLISILVKGGAAFPMLLMIILYPLMGFIGGIIGAALYNLASRIIGGLELTLEVTQEQNSPQ